MSLWTDIRNAFESPFIAISHVVTSPIDLTKDLVSGKNMLQSLREQWQEGVAPLISGPVGYLATSETGKSILDSKLANSLTFGMSSNVERTLGFTQNITNLTPEKITKDQALGTVRTVAVVGAVVGAAALAPAAVVTAQAAPLTTYGAAQVTYKAIASGDIVGAAAGLGGLAGVPLPSEVRDIQNAVAPIADLIPTSQGAAPNRVSDPFASPSGMWAQPSSSSGSSSYIVPAAIAGLGLLAFIAMRKR